MAYVGHDVVGTGRFRSVLISWVLWADSMQDGGTVLEDEIKEWGESGVWGLRMGGELGKELDGSVVGDSEMDFGCLWIQINALHYIRSVFGVC